MVFPGGHHRSRPLQPIGLGRFNHPAGTRNPLPKPARTRTAPPCPTLTGGRRSTVDRTIGCRSPRNPRSQGIRRCSGHAHRSYPGHSGKTEPPERANVAGVARPSGCGRPAPADRSSPGGRCLFLENPHRGPIIGLRRDHIRRHSQAPIVMQLPALGHDFE
ncbi:MAG: hypothetical protein BWY82_01926 [Verrucomicrobia bacterium ADurb.Bin474]|nr:MAG: hypothetical protein BWY82_01926 [Verrucomicrobia bacterium ADurb.Bin474]